MKMRNILYTTISIGLSMTINASAQTSTSAHQADDAEQRARQHFERGKAHYVLENYQEAVDEYLQAYELAKKPVLLYNIAQAYRLQGELENALEYYRRYVDMDPQGRGVEIAQTLIAELESQIAHRKQREARAREAREARDDIDEAATEAKTKSPRQESQTVVSDDRIFGAMEERDPEDVEWRWPQWIPWTVVGTGTVVALSGGFWAMRAKRSFDDFDQQLRDACPQGCNEGDPWFPAESPDRGTSQRNMAIGSYVAGGVIIASGLTMVLLNRPRAPENDLYTAVRITPSITPQGTSVTLGMQF